VLAHAHAGHSMAGSLFWCLTAASYPDYDGFKVLLQQPAAQRRARNTPRPAHGALSPTAKPGVVKRREQQLFLDQQQSDGRNGVELPSDGVQESVEAHDSLAATSEPGSEAGSRKQQQPAGCSVGEAGSSGSGLRGVSSATEINCSAAAAMFEAGDLHSVEEAVLLDTDTVSQIVRHGGLMQQLNKQETQRDCVLM
jgi:hypothetical protein